jgi:hypothetical protein
MVGYHRRRFGIPACDRSERTKAALKRKYPNGRRGQLAGNWKGGRVFSARSGPAHGRWKGGKRPTTSGYMRIWKPEHPAADRNGYVYEHRLVMEQKIGRLLKAGEIVDHIDRDRTNNHPDNLRLHENRSQHVKDHFSARDQLTLVMQKLARYEALYGPLPDDGQAG